MPAPTDPVPSTAPPPLRDRASARLAAGVPWLLGFALIAHAQPARAATVPAAAPELRQNQVIRAGRLGFAGARALAYSSDADLFIVLPAAPLADPREPIAAALMDRFGDHAGSLVLPVPLARVDAMAWDARHRRLLVLDLAGRALHAIPASAGGFEPARASRLAAPSVGLVKPTGMAVDPASGEVFVLDRLTRRLLRFDPSAAGAAARSDTAGGAGSAPGANVPVATWIELGPLATLDLRGLAFDPVRGHLFTLEPARRIVHELTTGGRAVAAHAAPSLDLADPRSLVIAPSADQTDDPAATSLYIAEPGTPDRPRGSVIEAAWAVGESGEAATSPTAAIAATLVRVTATSGYSPPSPDPSGVAYDAAAGRLVISDAEVEEMTIWAGRNVFEVSLAGALLRSYGVTSYSNEPTGVACDPGNRLRYFSDDDARRVFVIGPGADNTFGTSDDTRRSFTTRDFGSGDPEGISHDRIGRRLFIADGVNNEIYVLRPGANGIFDGASPTGDDQVTHFDTGTLGITDPETVEFKEDTGTLLTLGSGTKVVKELTTTGSVVSQIDLSFAPLRKPAGLAYGPTSNNPGGRSLYIVNRGTDNNSDPRENDGTLVEVGLGSPSGNAAPVVNAGPDQGVTLPAAATLDGTVTDDGLPNPPGATTVTWSAVSGPGPVSFQNPNAVDTQASFTTAGTYLLRLTASDGALSASDEVQVAVLASGSGGATVVERRIAAGADDAEESATGSVTLGSSDLELVYDGGNQTVGLRFTGVAIARGATIAAAWIQFRADETHSEVTSLSIRGEASDNAAAFTSAAGNLSTRARTTAAIAWSPPAWSTAGEAGPGQRTPDLRSVIQEIVGRPGWASGNSLALLVTGTGHRTAEAFEGMAAGAALLHIEIEPAGGGGDNAAPVVSAGPDLGVTLPAAATLDGTVTDDGLPNPPGATTVTWSAVSGPGPVSFQNPNAVDTQASFTTAGTYLLRLTASDGALSTSDEVQVAVLASGSGGATVVERRIAAGADDAEESATGSVTLTSSDLELIQDGTVIQTVGLRFTSLQVPPGAVIAAAHVQFKADELQSETTALLIEGEAVGNPAGFVLSSFHISARARTAAKVSWVPPAWTVVGEAATAQRTPDLATIVQEIVNRPDWALGNALALVITGTGHRTAEAYEGQPAGAALLHVEYRLPTP